jgi:hypothetical protein
MGILEIDAGIAIRYDKAFYDGKGGTGGDILWGRRRLRFLVPGIGATGEADTDKDKGDANGRRHAGRHCCSVCDLSHPNL